MDETLSAVPPSLLSRLKTRLASRRESCRHFFVKYRFEFFIFLFFSTIALIFLLPFIYHTIPAGHVGVLWKRFGGGTVTERVFPEGYRLTMPWDILYIYDARLQTVERDIEVLS